MMTANSNEPGTNNPAQPAAGQQPAWGPSFVKRYAYAIKAVLIGILVLLLLIPTTMVMFLIAEREQRQNEATGEVSNKWGNAQTVTGPVLAVPYIIKPGETGTAFFLPDKLAINGELLPEIRKRGIYEVAVYSSRLQLSGVFNSLDIAALDIAPESLLLQDAYLTLGVSDMRGIASQVQVQWNGQPHVFNPGVPAGGLLTSGMRTRLPLTLEGGSFSIQLQLKGSSQIYFSPVGKSTAVSLSSSWTHPSFDGAFLPKEHQVSNKGFTASWQVLHLNRNFPQSWAAGKYDLHTADFGVKLFLPVDGYQKSTRAVKYAILIIGLTFLVFYFIELLKRYSVHPLQYILIGFALCIFYTLLIALAEQLPFHFAYGIATLLTLGLVTAYTAAVFRSYRIALGIGGALLLLYGFIYVILSSEDQALLMGSLGLFIILALVMYFSRRIRWSEL